jgi:MFS family permease
LLAALPAIMPSTPPRPTLVFPLALVGLELVLYLSQDMYLPALPLVRDGFGVSTPQAQLSFSIWMLGAAGLQWLAGPVSDQVGRRGVLLFGCSVFVLASAGCAFAPSYALFLGCRALEGCGLCAVLVAGYASLHETLGSVQAVRTMAWMSSVSVLAPALGPLLGAAVLMVAPWQAMFVLLALGAGAAQFALHRHMPETVRRGVAPRLTPRQLLQSYLRLLRLPGFMLPVAICGLILSVLLSWNVLSPFLLRRADGSARDFVAAQAYLYGLYIVGNRLLHFGVERLPTVKLVRLALRLGLAGSAAALGAALLGLGSVATLLPFGAFTLSAGMLFAPLLRAALEHAGQGMGTSLAVYVTALNLAAVAATLLVARLQLHSLSGFVLLALLASLGAAALGGTRAVVRALERR